MSKSSADQNLLFGVLALELDFIDRDQLIQAMRGWVVEKSKSLGQLFVERGELTATRHELLQALVAEHLQQHGDDTNASLASLESTEDVVADLKEVPDDGMQATIDFISTPDKSGFIESKPSSKVRVARVSADRFEVIKKHAAGGLGDVFEAKDKELHRTVALKRIKKRFAHHEKSRERFKLEAEITGRLEHPGVVPVYSLGEHDDGQPFYAMRFIEGNTLADAIKEHHKKKTADPKTDGHDLLDLRRLLQRFIDVCQTIEYAHDRGVLHRDIKPSNVMLGRFGETLVVDWGLAKAAGRDVGHVRSDESTFTRHTAAGRPPHSPAAPSVPRHS
jgi:tRNA A-37 threonylcarbamoyl transferase component Bud32